MYSVSPCLRAAGIKLKILTVYGKTWHVVFSVKIELDMFFYKLYHQSATLRLVHFTKEITCFVHDRIEIKKLQSKDIATMSCYLCVIFLYAISMYMKLLNGCQECNCKQLFRPNWALSVQCSTRWACHLNSLNRLRILKYLWVS